MSPSPLSPSPLEFRANAGNWRLGGCELQRSFPAFPTPCTLHIQWSDGPWTTDLCGRMAHRGPLDAMAARMQKTP